MFKGSGEAPALTRTPARLRDSGSFPGWRRRSRQAQNGKTGTRENGDIARENGDIMKTTYERGIEDGIQRGERRSALRLMEARFGPLSLEVKQQVEALSPESLARLQIDLLKAQAVEELRLDD